MKKIYICLKEDQCVGLEIFKGDGILYKDDYYWHNPLTYIAERGYISGLREIFGDWETKPDSKWKRLLRKIIKQENLIKDALNKGEKKMTL